MNYYTMNDGREEYSPRSEVYDATINSLWDTFNDDGWRPIPIMHGYDVDVCLPRFGLFATIARRENNVTERLATFGVVDNAEDGEQVWRQLRSDYLHLCDKPGYRSADLAAPRMPNSIPWCAVYRFKPIDMHTMWLPYFERALAWTWVEWRKRRRQQSRQPKLADH